MFGDSRPVDVAIHTMINRNQSFNVYIFLARVYVPHPSNLNAHRLYTQTMSSTNALFWQLRQLAGRIRDDARQLEDILYYHPDLIAPLDIIKIIAAYWSEDPRAIDLIMKFPLLDSFYQVNLSDHDHDNNYPDIEIVSSFRHTSAIPRLTNDKFTTEIEISILICPIFTPSTEIIFKNGEALSALLILPEVAVNGSEVEFQYSEYVLGAIVGLRNDLYRKLDNMINWG